MWRRWRGRLGLFACFPEFIMEIREFLSSLRSQDLWKKLLWADCLLSKDSALAFILGVKSHLSCRVYTGLRKGAQMSQGTEFSSVMRPLIIAPQSITALLTEWSVSGVPREGTCSFSCLGLQLLLLPHPSIHPPLHPSTHPPLHPSIHPPLWTVQKFLRASSVLTLLSLLSDWYYHFVSFKNIFLASEMAQWIWMLATKPNHLSSSPRAVPAWGNEFQSPAPK